VPVVPTGEPDRGQRFKIVGPSLTQPRAHRSKVTATGSAARTRSLMPRAVGGSTDRMPAVRLVGQALVSSNEFTA
jgi:hypothetical protein